MLVNLFFGGQIGKSISTGMNRIINTFKVVKTRRDYDYALARILVVKQAGFNWISACFNTELIMILIGIRE